MRSRLIAGLLVACALLPWRAQAADPTVWFNKAVQYDLGGGEEAARLAFAWYRRAAEAGLPEAEFNVAVMLDSGRGVAPDLGQAATWYARAATHGNRRAAYNLGQLYEAGQGVVKNQDLAQAWFVFSDLPAARERIASPVARADRSVGLSAPLLVAPLAGEIISQGTGGIELIWTAPPQSEPVHFFVELRALGSTESREVFSSFTDTSGILATLPELDGDYAWRVLTVSRETNRYMASDWKRFSMAVSTWTSTSEAGRH